MKQISFNALMVLLLFAVANLASAEKVNSIDETKVATLSYPISENLKIDIEGKDIELVVEGWDRSEIEIIATIEFKGKEKDKIRNFLDNWEQNVKNNIRETALAFSIDMNPDEPNKVQMGNGKGGLIIGYSKDELRIKYEIKVPVKNELNIKNSYDDVVIRGAFDNDVSITHYSGNLSAEKFNHLELNLKYGKANLMQAKSSEMTLYEQEIEVQTLGASEIGAKYSKIDIPNVGDVDLESYESKIEFGVAGNVEGELKYGRLTITESFKRLELDTYELEMDFADGEMLVLEESKYSEISLGSVDNVILKASYEDDMEIDRVDAFSIKGKYGNIEIGTLTKSIEVDGYETDVDIKSISETVESVIFDGKYNKLYLDSGSIPLHVKADITYGDVDYSEIKLERKIYIKENSKLKIELIPKSGKEPKLIIDLKGYEMKAEIS